jgi:hypothetical protein
VLFRKQKSSAKLPSETLAEYEYMDLDSALREGARLPPYATFVSTWSSCHPCAPVFPGRVRGRFYGHVSRLLLSINGNQPNPTLTLVRGKTYTFAVNAGPTHPFLINSPGVQNNNISQGTISYTVPTVASNYTYICSIHGFGAQIVTVDPPAPSVRILSLAVSNNVVLRSTGTNGWSVHPEFSTNLITTNWFALSVLSNSFLNGINETICGRPPGSNVCPSDSFATKLRAGEGHGDC